MKNWKNGAWKAGLLAAGMALVFSAHGAQDGGPKANMPPGAGTQQMSEMMRDISGQMSEISKAMSRGNMTPAQQKQTAERVRVMSGMMENLSTMMGAGMMLGDQQQKQMQDMRQQIDGMMKQGGGMMPRK